MSETAKYRHVTSPYCKGNVIDIGAGGYDPVVPWAISIDLPPKEFSIYNQREFPPNIAWGGSCLDLPFKDSTVDTVYSSHLLEDFADWNPCLKEWVRVLKRNGNFIIVLPDKELWIKALNKGQPPNNQHRHEAYEGELSTYADKLGLKVIMDKKSNLFEGDYSIIFIAEKI